MPWDIDPDTGEVRGSAAIHQELTGETPRPRDVSDKKLAQPQATDFTTIVPAHVDESRFDIRVKLDSRWVTVGNHSDLEEAEKAELAINQVMIEYRAKRNEWTERLRSSGTQ